MGLGQKLEEARNRKGISIREATESTKIRSDYLSSFESGDFNINLPEVYLRGFVRLYSRFLGLDQEAIVADLEVELGVSSQSQRKSLGSITTSELSENKENIPTNKKSVSRVSKGSGLAKILVVLVIIGVGLSLVVTLAYQLFNNAEEPVEIDPSELLISEKKDAPDQVPTNPVVQIENNQLKLAAIGPIDRLIVCDEGVTPKKYHEFSNLPSGWEKTVEFKESFRCYSSSLENLRFAVDDGPEKKADGMGSGNFSWSK